MPKMSKLDYVTAKQSAAPGKWLTHGLTFRTRERVRAGASLTDALDGVLALYRQVVLDAIQAEQD